MCYFVFLGLPSRDHAEAIARSGFDVREARNPSLLASFPLSDVVLVVTRGGCSCGIYWKPPKFDEEAERRKYLSKGWSPGKIQRALLGKRPRPPAEATSFSTALEEVTRAAGAIRILAHWFEGDIDAEGLLPCPRIGVSLHEYLAQAGHYPEDAIVEITAEPRP
jgi:hypothetical protein